ncbi:MAG: HK97 family phage prohead protease [Bacteroidaceae bacterium]|nr:HK97 family phage prohead protease [Bacteroidaceae bacterium]
MAIEQMKSLVYKTKANDVDEKGIVTVAVNGIGVKDSQGDISMPGSFDKTLTEHIHKMRWFLNHKTDQLLGVPLSGKEENGNLVMVGKINLEKQMGRDVLADYKLYAENGRTLEHSIGVSAVKRDEADKSKVLEWKMWEYSTLTAWGANPQTFLVNIKSATREQVEEAARFLSKAAEGKYGHSDERLNSFDMELKKLLKALDGANIVKCPYCGKEFDYDEQVEHSFSTQVLENAAMYARWIAEGKVSEEMHKLTPEIQAEVMAVLQAVNVMKADGHRPSEQKALVELYTEKNIQDAMTYVRCPHCWERVYKTMTVIGKAGEDPTPKNEPSGDTHEKGEGGDDPEKTKAADGTFDYLSLGDCFAK